MKKKIFVLLVALLMVLPVFSNAESLWYYDKITDTLILNGNEYLPCELEFSDHVLPLTYRVYKTESQNEIFYIYETDTTDDLVFVNDYSSYNETRTVHANARGKEILEKFQSGEYSSYKLFRDTDYYSSGFNSAFIKTLDDMPATMELTVSSMEYLQRYDVAGLDETGTLYRVHGAFYEYKNNFYYVNYDALDNTYFDADGNFSFRRGTVKLVEVPENIESEIRSAASGIRYSGDDYIHTFDVYNTASDNFGDVILFVISTVILGYLIPLVPFVLSIIFAHSKKALYPKRWYLLTLCSSVWMIVATCLVIMVVIA